jgi:iron complex outermembrane receptor protein
MSSNFSLRQAVGLAVGTAGATAASLGYMPLAQAADAAGPSAAAAPDTSLEEVVVTGSRVRRVDAETANPVFVLDADTIKQSGANTVGDLISRIPSIAGQAINPSVNNGGGFGESNIELRGLDSKRTLILIDGRRVNLNGNSDAVDVNQIPVNYIERVDVLKEGAGAIYGSDAIAGVVNFITRKNIEGLELTGDWGESSKHDAQHHNVGLLFGTTSDKWSFQAGVNYNQQDELTMGARNWSKYALYLYSGTLNKAGSSRIATGNVAVPASLAATYGCGHVTRIDGAAGTALADYRCTTSTDRFNFQPYNLNVTPQERAAFFTKLNYQINDNVEAYASVIYNHTHSGFQLAPLPFDALADNIIISKDNIYNPFGSDFGGSANPNYTLRLSALGDRRSDSTSASVISNVGVKGKVADTGWNYDWNVSYNRLDQEANISGYLLFSQLQNAVGPSFWADASGASVPAGTPGAVATCGTALVPIPGCTPVNIFNLAAPDQIAALNSIKASYTTQATVISKGTTLDFNGPIVKLPAGDALGSVGVSYTGLEGMFTTSTIAQGQAPSFLNCYISQEACSGNSLGKYNFKEVYGEIFVPLLKDLPLVNSLNIDGGVRYSDYSIFGSTTKGDFKVEYRPIKDLLIRGTFSQIYRAPTIQDISNAPLSDSPTLNDPCNGYAGVPTAQYPNLPAACVGVPPDGSFAEPNNQVTGQKLSNKNLKPETGHVKTFGFVYDPSYVRGLSLSVDYWKYDVNDLLTQLDPNYTATQCATTASPEFCSLMHRFTAGPNAGQFQYFSEPTFNLGKLSTDGVDFDAKYQIGRTPIGDFNVSLDVTHLMTYKNTPAPGSPTVEIAGQYNKQFGFYAKNRGTLNIGWSGWGAEALVTTRFIDHVDIPLTNASFNADGSFNSYLGYHLGSVMYYDLTGGYTIEATRTSLRAGILNLADKTPPIAGINSFSTGSSVTDVTQYDTIGRRFFVGFTQKF